jgi:hypothetical protein
MSISRISGRLSLAALAATAAVMVPAGDAHAAAPPIKLVLSSRITGSFEFLEGVAANNDPASARPGDIYVTENAQSRVRELTAAGAFVAMFGREVDATTKGDVCTAASKDTCKAGVTGGVAGALAEPQSLAVDPATANVYVDDRRNFRVDEYTPDGQFVLMIGMEVNATKDKVEGSSPAERNLCTATSKDICKTGVQAPTGSTERGAFNLRTQSGDLLAVGGPKGLLYVGDEHRVQEFHPDGTWAGEIPLTSIPVEPSAQVSAIALDQETADLYLVYNTQAAVHEFNVEGQEVTSLQVTPREAGRSAEVDAIALDSSDHLAVAATEVGGPARSPFGSLYTAAGQRITGFSIPAAQSPAGVAFNNKGELYAPEEGVAVEGGVLVYTPEPVAFLSPTPAECNPGAEHDTSVTLDCTLNGEANPEGVSETEVFFEWGRTQALGETTTKQKVEETEVLHAPIVGVRPNQTFFYRLAGFDHNVQPPEQLTSELATLDTPTVPPRITGTPTGEFATSFSVVFVGELNPENASTTYEFQYARACNPEEVCPAIAETPGMMQTATQESAAYGRIGVAAEVTGLQPSTTYRFRLAAINGAGEAALGETGQPGTPEGVFTTAPPAVPQAHTGPASAVGVTSATLSGTVDPDGQAATYAFELGVDQGAQTQYGTVFSGSAGAGRTPTEERLAVSGLQPGSTYAYRIAISSGSIPNADHTIRGAPVLFTTLGLPAVLSAPFSPPLLSAPSFAFPAPPTGKPPPKACKRGYKRDRYGRCVKTKTLKTKKPKRHGRQARRGKP